MSLTEVFDKYSNFDTNLYGIIRDYENGEPKQNYKKVIYHLNFLIASDMIASEQYNDHNDEEDIDLEFHKKAYIARDMYFSKCCGRNLNVMLTYNLNKLKNYNIIFEEKEKKMLKAIADNDISAYYDEYDTILFYHIAGW